jgi:hypothetical protein
MKQNTTQAAAVSPATPFEVIEAHYRQAQTIVNTKGSTEAEMQVFLNAVDLIDSTRANTLQEFVRSFIIAMDDGGCIPNEETLMRLLADAQRLVTSRFEILRLEYVDLMQVQAERKAESRDWQIEKIMVNEPSQSVADARAKLRFIVDADRLGVSLDGDDAAKLAVDAAPYLAPVAAPYLAPEA